MFSSRKSHILHRTQWTPPLAVASQGIHITLDDGRTLIDAVGGAASVGCLGSNHPKVVEAMYAQSQKMGYVFNVLLSNEPAEALADVLIETSNGAFATVAFVSGGSEAMEGALKTAIQYFQEGGQPQRVNFIGKEHSYHGATLGCLAVSGHTGHRRIYEANLKQSTFHHVSAPYYSRLANPGESEEAYVERLVEELDAKFKALGGDTVAAFVIETVAGSTLGCVTAPRGYFKAVKAICDKYGALVIYDEVMCGMGRMGSLHAWETFADGIPPDLQAVAKGLGGGFAPIGAVLMSQRVLDGIKQGAGYWHGGHTYSAHPTACAAALAVQTVLREENLLSNVVERGAQLESLLRARLFSESSPAAPFMHCLNGGGLFWGLEFNFDERIVEALGHFRFSMRLQMRTFEKGLLVMGFGRLPGIPGDHIMLAPAYNVTAQEIETIVDLLVESIEEVLKEVVALAETPKTA